ncbi:MAG TPA: hypothetical protein VN200_07170 [Rhodoglobus sp.]|nr:hypothetical protein [Rhodoglobus sp.]
MSPKRSEDDIAIERYRYLLRTAPPETIEQVHAEAFEKLTPQQRRKVYDELSRNSLPGEQPRDDEPQSLAAAATRNELRQPGTMERSFGGPSFLGMFGSSLLGTIAGYVIASALVSAFMPDPGADTAGGEGDGSGDGSDSGGDGGDGGGGDAGADASADAGGGDFGGGDFFGGGGDFGGGDFGGGDFGF